MDRLKAIEYFIKTVELGGFTAAAKSLGVPASSVSRRVQDLEETLGTSLLHRTTRAVNLTELGALYLEQVRPALEALAHADDVILDRPTSPTGQLRITAAPTFGTVALLPAVTKLRDAYPDLIVDLELTDHAYNLANNEVDIAIRATADLPERVIARKLVDNNHQLVASPDYLARRGTPRHLADLSQHQAVFYRIPGRIVDWHAKTAHGWRDVQIHRGFVSNISEALLSEVLAGRGFALFPSWGIGPELASGALIPITLRDARLSLSRSEQSGVYLLYNQPKYRLNKIKTTVDFLVRELAR
ncbi:MAG: LysR family transcriptional regulator [Pseudomonadota bacterium]